MQTQQQPAATAMAAKTTSSSRMRRTKVLFFGDDDSESARQAEGPHAHAAGDTCSSDDDGDGDDTNQAANDNVRDEHESTDASAHATSSGVAAHASAPASSADAIAASSTGAAGVASTAASAVVASTADSPAVDAVGTDAAESEAGASAPACASVGKSPHKRKRATETAEAADDDVQPLRLKKVYRPKAAASRSSSAAVAASKPSRNEASPSFASPSSMLSPMKDDSKKKRTPRKSRLPKKPQSLHTRMDKVELSETEVVELIAELFEEQEQDDRDMYNILTQTVKEQTQQCEHSDVVEELSQMEFRRMLTYGEVSVESVSKTILPFLKLQADDVFYDLGCGSGKIVLQAVLQTPCAVAKGIELMQNRVLQGTDALERLRAKSLRVMDGKTVEIVQGDICKPPTTAPMTDATVVFINNVCFGPELMLRVSQMLTLMPKLRRVVTLRKFCVRHRPQKCQRAQSYCVEYVHPPAEAEICVSWASKTSVYLYERVGYSLERLAAQLQVPLESAAPSQDVCAVRA